MGSASGCESRKIELRLLNKGTVIKYYFLFLDISITEVVDWFSVPDKHPNDYPCLRHKKKIRKFVLLGRRNVHVYNPNCDKDGMYDKKQCHRGTCWCADREGKRIKGSSNKGSVECGMCFFINYYRCILEFLTRGWWNMFERFFN